MTFITLEPPDPPPSGDAGRMRLNTPCPACMQSFVVDVYMTMDLDYSNGSKPIVITDWWFICTACGANGDASVEEER